MNNRFILYVLQTAAKYSEDSSKSGNKWEPNTQEQYENSTINIHVNHREAKTGIYFIQLITRRSSVQI